MNIFVARIAPPRPDSFRLRQMDAIHSERSSYREILIEHVFSAELMKLFWHARGSLLEVAKPQVDDGGYDLVMEVNGIIRHVQLKSSHGTSHLRQTTVALSLGRKPSGCVIVVRFAEPTLELGPFHFFGGAPGEPLPDLSGFKVAKRTTPNREGTRPERAAHRCVPLSRFTPVAELRDLAAKLFGLKP